MLRWLERAMPHAQVPADNPIFKYEVRRIRWGRKPNQLTSFACKLLIIIPLVIVAVWRLYLSIATGCCPEDTSVEFIGLLVLICLGATVVLDFVSLFASNNNYPNTTRYDLIRLTPLSGKKVVVVKHALAQIDAWRAMAFVTSLRMSVALLALIHGLLLSGVYGSEKAPYLFWGFLPQ